MPAGSVMMKRAIHNRLSLILFAVALIQSCATVTPVSVDFKPENYDHLFPGFESIDTIPQDTIFYLNDKSKAYVRERAALAETTDDKALTLINDLFSPSQLALDYVYGANTVAQETLVNGTANCLSLTILAYAMAQEADLSVKFQEVFEQESWNQAGEFDLANGHVNLLITRKPRFSMIPGMVSRNRTYTVDFFPESREDKVKTKEISKRQIQSYFYSNIGARALIEEDHITAWANFRKALQLYERDSSSWNNLGLLLSRQGAKTEAIQAYNKAIALEPDNQSALENLAVLLQKQGKEEQASEIKERLNRLRQDNPNYHVRVGNRFYINGDLEAAREAFRRSLRLQRNNHLAWFGLAKVAMAVEDETAVREFLLKAKNSANSEGFERRYARKLHALNQSF